jgi:hypothetical protein
LLWNVASAKSSSGAKTLPPYTYLLSQEMVAAVPTSSATSPVKSLATLLQSSNARGNDDTPTKTYTISNMPHNSSNAIPLALSADAITVDEIIAQWESTVYEHCDEIPDVEPLIRGDENKKEKLISDDTFDEHEVLSYATYLLEESEDKDAALWQLLKTIEE